MKFVYIAHPIAAVAIHRVMENLHRVEKIVAHIMQTDLTVWPIAPYVHAVRYLDDANPKHRERAFEANRLFFKRHLIDELWVCGGLSQGVVREIIWAGQYDIKVAQKDFNFLFEAKQNG